jgi:lipopolysaccharide export system protein LptA
LSNRAADKCSLLHPLKRWTAAAFGAVVALALWTSINRAPLWAQSLRGPSTLVDNPPPSQEKLDGVEKSEKPAAGSIERGANRQQGSKSAPSDSNNENNQTPFGSLGNSNRGPISIQSDSLALDYKQNVVVFNGHVHATQADAALTSNTLNVKYGKDFHEVQHMVAVGKVHISQGVRWCTSDNATMDQGQHTVILTGTPICHDARDQITGTRITVHLDTGKSDVEGAKAVIFPQPSKTRDNEALAAQAK